jgi:hypothetical protein
MYTEFSIRTVQLCFVRIVGPLDTNNNTEFRRQGITQNKYSNNENISLHRSQLWKKPTALLIDEKVNDDSNCFIVVTAHARLNGCENPRERINSLHK